MALICPLCQSVTVFLLHADNHRDYLRCSICQLVHVPAEFHLSAKDEKAHYDTHENNPADEGYRRFLERMFAPLSTRLTPHSSGLDFGCGPGPTLSVMFAEQGHNVTLYDLYYAPHSDALAAHYDFITATEVIEHLKNPRDILSMLWTLLQPGGWLGLMTRQLGADDAFSSWYYKNDPTHIAFFARHTFCWLGNQWGVEPCFEGADVVLFQKPLAPAAPAAHDAIHRGL